MLKLLVRLFRTEPWFTALASAVFVTEIGNGFTAVLVFAELSRMRASPLSMAAAVGMIALPSLVGAKIGEWLAHRANPLIVMASMEGLSALSVLILFPAVAQNSIGLFLLVEGIGGLLSGIAIPNFHLSIRRFVPSEFLPAVSAFDALTFSANVLIGAGLGALIYPYVSSNTFIVFDLATYVMAVGLLLLSASWARKKRANSEESIPIAIKRFQVRELDAKQLRSLLLLPALTLVAAPAFALLPTFALRFGVDVSFGGVTIIVVTAFLFVRSVGQLLGPFVVRPSSYKIVATSNWTILAILTAFLILYIVAASTPYFLMAIACIFVAHVASNLAHASGQAHFYSSFDDSTIASASSFMFRLQMVVYAIAVLGAGLLAEFMPPNLVLVLFGLGSLLTLVVLTFKVHLTKDAIQ